MRKLVMFSVLLFLLMNFSCKTYLPIDSIPPKAPKKEKNVAFKERQLTRLKIGDSVLIQRTNYEPVYMMYLSTSRDSIFGVKWKIGNRRLISKLNSGVPINNIQSIRIRKFDPAATALFAGVGVPIIALAGFAVVIMFGGDFGIGF